MSAIHVRTASQAEHVAQPCGSLTWNANRALGNSTSLTTGICRIAPGGSTPFHHHDNCDEVLLVWQGHIRHSSDAPGGDTDLNPGDCVSIPAGRAHQAHNLGAEEAVLFLAFSSADRHFAICAPPSH